MSAHVNYQHDKIMVIRWEARSGTESDVLSLLTVAPWCGRLGRLGLATACPAPPRRSAHMAEVEWSGACISV